MTENEMVGCITHTMDMNLSKVQEMVKDREAWLAAVLQSTEAGGRGCCKESDVTQ